MGKVVLNFPGKVDSGAANKAFVQVTGAVKGDKVTIWVERRDGGQAVDVTERKVERADGSGSASHVFDNVVLSPAGSTVVLVAQASDSQGPHFDLNPQSVQVT
jgi:hypothetical protein